MVVTAYEGHTIQSSGGGAIRVKADMVDAEGMVEEIELESIEGGLTTLLFTPEEAFDLGLALLRDYSLMTRGRG
jgi:hypothetical protein